MLLSFFLNYRNSGNTQFFFLDKRGSARAQQLGAEIVLSERVKAEGSLNPAQQISRGDAEARRWRFLLLKKVNRIVIGMAGDKQNASV